MADDYRNQVSAAMQQASKLPPIEREAFMAKLLKENLRVGSEVARLLGQSGTEFPPETKLPTAEWNNLETPDLGGLPPAKPLAPIPAMPANVAPQEHWPERIGRYVIEQEIAGGGAGIVLRARDERFNRTLAVKLMRQRFRGHAEAVQRFREEAQITGQLQHPGVPPVYDLGQLDDGRPFLAMKLIKGRTLADWLRTDPERQAELPRFLAIFEQICQTMAYAHSRRIIHRDLKPGNVMVGAFGEVQVMDWGLAKLMGASPDELSEMPPEQTILQTTREPDSAWETRHGLAMGTPAFMSPEQARGEVAALDERTDVFSLGAILCDILTGRPPYPGETPTEILAMAQRGDLVRAFERLDACGADGELVALARRCLSPERAGRPRDAGEVAAEVASHLARVQERLRQAEIERAQRDVQTREERKRRRVQLGLAGSFAALVVLGILAWSWIDRVQAAESARFESQFERAVARAETIRDQATAVRLTGLDDWKQADALWQQAVTAADDVAANLLKDVNRPELSARLALIRDELKPQAAAIRKDRRMFEWLDRAFEMRADIKDSDYLDTRMAVVIFGRSGANEYAAAFRDYGADVLKLEPAEAVRRLKRSAIKSRLAEALTDWVVLWYTRPEAKRLLKVVEALDPDAQRSAIRTALLGGDRKRLVNLAKKIDAKKSSPTTILPLADALHLVGEINQAIDLLERARRHRPQEFWYNDVLAVLIAAAHPERIDDAIAYLQAAAALRPGLQVVYGNLAIAETVTGRWQRAEAYARRALELAPDSAFNQLVIAEVYFAQQRWQEARTAIDACLARHPKHPQALNCLARIQTATGAFAPALTTIDRALASDPGSSLALQTKGNILLSMNQLDEAASIGQRLVKDYPHLNMGYETLAIAAGRKGRLDVAESWLRLGLRNSVLPGALRSLLAETLADRDLAAAVGHARRVLHDLPQARGAVIGLGNLLQKNRILYDAQVVYWNYLMNHPEDVEIRDRLMAVLKFTGYGFDEVAQTMLADAIRTLPPNGQAEWRAMFLEVRKSRPAVARRPRARKRSSADGKP